MASDSVANFLDLARTHRILLPDYVDGLSRQDSAPLANCSELCDYLQRRGLLTAYQSALVRDRRASELAFAGYPILDELGPCPGGMAYRVLHPSLRTALVLRKIRPSWLQPADDPTSYIQRAQQAAPITHPNLPHLLDAGIFQDQLFITQEPINGGNLFSLVQDIGAMPNPVAMQYLRQAAEALNVIHSRGLVHGQISPGMMVVTPLAPMSKLRDDGTPMMRPAPDARLILTEFGLIPNRPALRDWLPGNPTPPVEFAFFAPERLAEAKPTVAGDIYSLGASLYYLLTAYPPLPTRTSEELLDALAQGQPPAIATIRPDLPPELAQLIEQMMAREPASRPTLTDILQQLQDPQGHPAEATAIILESPPNVSAASVEPDAPENTEELAPLSVERPAGEGSSESLQWTTTPLTEDPQSGIGTFVPESYHGTGTSSTELKAIPTVTPDSSWPGFPSESPPAMPQTGWPGFAELPPSEVVVPAWDPAAHAAPAADEYPDPLHQDTPSAERSPTAYAPRTTEVSKKNVWLWVGVGAGLQVLAILGWVYLAMSPGCHSTPAPNPAKKSRP